jgi:phage shock protein A
MTLDPVLGRMGLLDRTSDLARRRVDRLLDDLDDPAQRFEYTRERLDEELRRVDGAIVDLVTERKRLETRRTTLEERIDDHNERAREAVRAERDDLAREVLERKQADVSRLNDVEDRIADLRETETETKERRDELKTRIDRFRAERTARSARRTAASAEASVSEATATTTTTAGGADRATADAAPADRIDDAEARAAALEELDREGFFDDDRHEEEIDRIRTDAEVEAELDTLRGELRDDPERPGGVGDEDRGDDEDNHGDGR